MFGFLNWQLGAETLLPKLFADQYNRSLLGEPLWFKSVTVWGLH